MVRSWAAVIAAVLVAVADAHRTLVVCDRATQDTHSRFFASLKERDHELTFKEPGASDVSARVKGERVFDNIILFAPKATDYGSDMSAQSLMEFMDEGGNILVAGGIKPGVAVRELARQAGFIVEKGPVRAIDHVSRDASDSGNSTLLALDVSTAHPAVIGPHTQDPILYSGMVFTMAPRPLAFPVMRAPSTAYAGVSGKKAPDAPACTGEDCLLVGAMQARNNARFVLVGSIELFSDKLMKSAVKGNQVSASVSGNEAFARELTKWVMREKSMLHAASVEVHNLQPKAPGLYTVKDEAEYEIVIEELVDGEWKGYSGHTDVQLKYTRMDPFVVTMLTPGPNGKYSTKFILPDVYGLFTFKVNYHKTGYSNLDDEKVEVIRPLRNTHHERFLFGAYPYYISSFSMMAGVFLLSFVYLYHRDAPKSKKE